MASERIVSPAVFTRERDQSFLPQGIGAIGGAFIGPTVKGRAFVPTVINNGFTEFEQRFGSTNEKFYVPFALQNYLKHSATATVVRVLGTEGYKLTHPLLVVATGSYGKKLVSVLHPTYVVSSGDNTSLFAKSTLSSNANGNFVLKVSGSFATDSSEFTAFAPNNNGTAYSASINPNSVNFIGELFGYGPEGQQPVYNYATFATAMSASLAASPTTTVYLATGSLTSQPWDFTDGYTEASTPWITSQKISGRTYQLFKFHTLSHGTNANYEIKVGISNIKPAGTIPGSEYGSFTVTIRAVDQAKVPGSPFNYQDSDSRPLIVEEFVGVNLDPNSPNFIQRRIGDKNIYVDGSGKLISEGDYQNLSKYVRVEVHEAAKAGAYSTTFVPFGFEALFNTVPKNIVNPTWVPAAAYVQDQNIGGLYNKRKYFGFDYDFTNTDNLNYLKPLPVENQLSTGSNVAFYLGDFNQPAGANYPSPTVPYTGSINLTTTQTSEDTRKFMVPFQGGFDGFKPNVQRRTGKFITSTNQQGFDLSQGADGWYAYRQALSSISNSDEYDINLVVMPGVIHQYHSGVSSKAIELCEDRGDCFYLMDGSEVAANVTTAVAAISDLDTNYAATYYPWVKVMDRNKNKPIWVPPSVVMAGVLAYSDKVSDPWFAPAGLNRGGIPEAVEAYTRLTHEERDELYEGRVNPIASFPGEGVVAWGQKTLQAKPSALDRINVRRLLITTKKYIASVTRYLVFENNTATTRNRFLNIVNPYLESVQQRQGLYAFKVVMDETNNTPDIIDRNILYGQIYLQPAKTAEFVVLDFNIMPTGAAFPGA